jgi:hypothetical protein
MLLQRIAESLIHVAQLLCQPRAGLTQGRAVMRHLNTSWSFWLVLVGFKQLFKIL